MGRHASRTHVQITVRCGVMSGPYDRRELFWDGSVSFGLCFVDYGLVRATVQRQDFRAGLGAFWSAAVASSGSLAGGVLVLAPVEPIMFLK